MTQYQTPQAAQQAVAIRQWRPWTRSTGPTTPHGRSVVAGNSVSHAAWNRPAIELRRAVAGLLDQVRATTTGLAEQAARDDQ